MLTQSNPSLVWCSGGVLETSFLPYAMRYMSANAGVNVCSVLTQSAEKFVSKLAIEAITETPVYAEGEDLHPVSRLPFHLVLSESDMLLVYPMTPRIISEVASGSITCPVTRTIAFSRAKYKVFFPFLHPNLSYDLYEKPIERIAAEIGHVVYIKGDVPKWDKVVKTIKNHLQADV